MAEKAAKANIGEADQRAHGQPLPARAVAILAMNSLGHPAATEQATTPDGPFRETGA